MTNMEATAFLGVVGWDKRVFYYELYPKSVNGDKFRLFLRNLRYKLGRQRVVIYMDNLRLHHSKATIRVMDELNMIPLFCPVYSPNLNPIEFVFSKVKQLARKARLNDMMNNRKRTYHEIVPEVIREITKEDVNNCIYHVYKLFFE